MAESIRVLLAGGGTAGHVNPMLALAAELRRRHPDAALVALGTTEGLEARLVPAAGLELAVVPRVPLPRRPSTDLFRLPGRLRQAVAAAGRAMDTGRVQVVVGFGGYVSTPAYLAARRRSIPVVVHEQNARPGLANRLGARWAAAVGVTFPGTRLPRATVTGLPLRADLAALVGQRREDPAGTRRAAAEALGLDPDRTTLLVSGGSLGALSVNRAVAGAAEAILATGAQVLHLTGRGKADEVRRALAGVSGGERWQVREYLDEMHLGLALADLVVGRAGAGTVCELAALGVPAVYVPLPIGNGEQRRNAHDVVSAGGGLLVEDAVLDPAWVRDHVPALLEPAGAPERERMSRAAASVGVRDGAARLADLVEAHLGIQAAPVPSESSGPPTTASALGSPTDPDPLAGPDPVAALGRVHLIGVGGVGMSAVAMLLAARGVVVSGSDAQDGPGLADLRAAGVRVRVGHDASAVDEADTVVVSSAVRESNPELAEARGRGLRVLHRSEALAALMAGRPTVAVAGAHGKTTTSAMIAVGLLHAGADPSFAIGGAVRDDTGTLGGARHGTGPFVAEADESDGSFLAYTPQVAVVTNVEPDHLDHYGTREAFEQAFVDFAGRVTGTLVLCADDPGAARLADAARRPGLDLVTYGAEPGADVSVGPVEAGPDGWSTQVAAVGGASVRLRLPAPGDHNALDVAAAWVVLCRLGVDPARAATALAAFRGTGRRFEDRGSADGVRVVDDYAHHPTEVAAVLRSARAVVGDGRVVVLFQPHLFSRTKAFAAEFGAALDLADEVVVTAVYAAREDPDPRVSGQMLVDAVPTAGKARYVADREEAAHAAADAARPGDLVLTVGAGDVTGLAPVVLADLEARAR